MTTEEFSELKEEILRRAKEASACREQYGRAYKAESMSELCAVLKDNFWWAVHNSVLDIPLLEKYREGFAEHDIFVNVSVEKGFLLCGNATVKACGNATVKACGNATVEACDNATVEACGNATVKAWDNATVKACGNATVKAWDNATVKAWGNATVEACDNATVEACGNAYVSSYVIVECKLSDNAIYRIRRDNIIRFASDSIKFEKA